MENNLTQEEPVNELVLLLKEKNISEEIALSISPAFIDFYNQTNDWKTKATEYLSDPNLSDDEKVKEVRKARLALVKVRTGIDKVRKALNDGDQQKISDRNSAAKIITALVTPTEEKLEEFEKRKEREEQEKKDKVKNERLEKIAPYNVDCTFFDLANMPEEAFSVLLENSRLAHEKKIEDDKKRMDEFLKAEKVQSRKMELIQLGFTSNNHIDFTNEVCDVNSEDIEYKSDENWSLMIKNIKDEKDKIAKEEAAKKKAEEDRLKAEKEAAERKALLLQQEQKEREEKHKTAVLRQQKLAAINHNAEYEFCNSMTDQSFEDFFKEQNSIYQAEENRKFIEKKKAEREAAEKKATEEAEAKAKREAELAPEKTKLFNWVNAFCLPALSYNGFSDEGKKVCEDIFNRSQAFNKWANDQINTLK